MFYRVKQFYNGLMAKVTDEDKHFLNQYLTETEKELFFQLRLSEQYHSLNVAYGCLLETPQNTKLIKAALLHDVGKVGTNLTLINKSFVVVAKKLNIEKKYLPAFLKKAIEDQLSHPQRGYELLKKLNSEEYVLNIVLLHHQSDATERDIKILQKYDDLH